MSTTALASTRCITHARRSTAGAGGAPSLRVASELSPPHTTRCTPSSPHRFRVQRSEATKRAQRQPAALQRSERRIERRRSTRRTSAEARAEAAEAGQARRRPRHRRASAVVRGTAGETPQATPPGRPARLPGCDAASRRGASLPSLPDAAACQCMHASACMVPGSSEMIPADPTRPLGACHAVPCSAPLRWGLGGVMLAATLAACGRAAGNSHCGRRLPRLSGLGSALCQLPAAWMTGCQDARLCMATPCYAAVGPDGGRQPRQAGRASASECRRLPISRQASTRTDLHHRRCSLGTHSPAQPAQHLANSARRGQLRAVEMRACPRTQKIDQSLSAPKRDPRMHGLCAARHGCTVADHTSVLRWLLVTDSF